jgi:hypothetical protein
MSNNLKIIFFCCCLSLTANSAFAVSDDSPVIRLGGVSAYPGIGLTEKHDSNITQATDSGISPRISSNVAVLSPALVVETEQAANKYSFTYSADIARYSSSSADNYADHHYLGLAEFGLSSSAILKLQPEYLIGHDDRGSTFGAPTGEPNQWHSKLLLGIFEYGADEARGHLVVDLGYTSIKYQNNASITDVYNRKLTSAGGTLYVRVLPKTSLLLNAKHTGISYDDPVSSLSGNEQLLRAGVKWEATAQTSGEIKVGKLQKNFDSSSAAQYSGGSWQADMNWSPVPYVNVDLSTSKEATETTLAGSSAIMLSNTGANLSYELNDRITLRANGYQLKQDFVGASRSDSTNTFGLKAEYKFRKWLIGGAEYSNSAKSSNDAANDFKRNIFMLSVRTAL